MAASNCLFEATIVISPIELTNQQSMVFETAGWNNLNQRTKFYDSAVPILAMGIGTAEGNFDGGEIHWLA